MTSAPSVSTEVEFRGSSANRLVADLFDCATERPTVVLAHGGGQNRHAWARSAAALHAAGHRVVAYDQRGHGDSEWITDGAGDDAYGNDTFARDLLAVRDAVDTGTGVIGVGASLGGMAIVGAHAIASSSLWRGVVLVDVTPRIEPGGAQRIITFMSAHPDGFATLDEAADVIAAYNPHRPRPTSTDGLTKVLRRRDDGRWMWRWDPAFVIGRADVLSVAPGQPSPRLDMMAEHMLASARQITAPALLVRGALSDLVSPETAREFLTVVPHARYVDVADAGHMVAGDNNDPFTTAVLDFLDSLA